MNATQFKEFLKEQSTGFTPVIDTKYSQEDYVAIDLSSENKNLKNIDVSSSQAFEDYIKSYLNSRDRKVAYGGYIETRDIYSRSTYFNQNNKETERNIHLGIDVWIEAGTLIVAPLSGTIHSFKNNMNFGDYGPTIILEHILEGVTFYTLYGHLSKASIKNLDIGQHIAKGQSFARLGTAEINGDYAPHLHFQIIKDLEDNCGDYPGVCSSKNLEHYRDNCPDPNLLVNI